VSRLAGVEDGDAKKGIRLMHDVNAFAGKYWDAGLTRAADWKFPPSLVQQSEMYYPLKVVME
jgi:hypothetical protein